MDIKELQQIKGIATHFLKHSRSKEEVLNTLVGAGILDKQGRILSPYDQIFSYK